MAKTTDSRVSSFHSKNLTGEIPEWSSATNSLRGASTTIGKAGEQIMGALSSKKQSSKADPRLFPQLAAGTSNHFGGVVGGGSYVLP